jgi:hypothetical protein
VSRPGVAVAVRVAVPVPPGWYELALSEVERPVALEVQWSALLRAHPELDRPAVAAAFRATLGALAAHYAADGAAVAMVEWDAPSGEPPRAVLDVKVADALDYPGALAEAGDEAEGLLGLLMQPAGDDVSNRSAERVDLPAGPAVRLRVLAPGGAEPGGRELVCDLIQYWIVLPTAPATVIVSCSSSRLEDGDRNAALVDQLAGALVAQPRPRADDATTLRTDSRGSPAAGGGDPTGSSPGVTPQVAEAAR